MLKSILDLFKYKQKIKEQERAIRFLEQKVLMWQQECEYLKDQIRTMQTNAFSYEDDYLEKEGDEDGGR